MGCIQMWMMTKAPDNFFGPHDHEYDINREIGFLRNFNFNTNLLGNPKN